MRTLLRSLFPLALAASLTGCLLHRDLFAVGATPAPDYVSSRHFEPLAIERPSASSEGGADATPAVTSDDALLVALRSAVILSGAKSVGSTSLVYKVPLDGGLTAAFKPDTRKHPNRWRAEVAAYRLSRALGLDGVPPSVPRAAKLSALVASLPGHGAASRLKKQAILSGEDALPGAMIAWLPALKRFPLERDPLYTASAEWLGQGTPKRPIEKRLPASVARLLEAARPLAAQISSMIAFDQVTGNVDRWSGNNVMLDETGTRLVYLDNNLAFLAEMPPAADKKRAAVLARVERFSRALVGKLRALDRATLVEALGVDQDGTPLLTDAQIDAVFLRRAQLLSHVDRLIERYGEAAVLSFA